MPGPIFLAALAAMLLPLAVAFIVYEIIQAHRSVNQPESEQQR